MMGLACRATIFQKFTRNERMPQIKLSIDINLLTFLLTLSGVEAKRIHQMLLISIYFNIKMLAHFVIA